MSVRFPASDERTVIIGATGSGKTQFGVYLLATRDYHRRPWFILDFKGEKLFPLLEMTPFSLGDPLPTEPGLYWIRIIPGEDEAVSNFFLQVYNQENCGIFIDEGYMLPYQDKWFRALQTQGRSKNVEVITLTQRPARLDLTIFSEASFFCVFTVTLKDDKKRIYEFTEGLEIKRLPKYHSLWYDVGANEHVIFEPCPPADKLVEIFRDFEAEENDDEHGDETRRQITAL